jgi:hypothetical protein
MSAEPEAEAEAEADGRLAVRGFVVLEMAPAPGGPVLIAKVLCVVYDPDGVPVLMFRFPHAFPSEMVRLLYNTLAMCYGVGSLQTLS